MKRMFLLEFGRTLWTGAILTASVVSVVAGTDLDKFKEVRTIKIFGNVAYTYYDGLGRTNRVRTEDFLMEVDEKCRYLIRLVKKGSGSDYFEVGYDATNSYYLNNLSTAVAEARAKNQKVGSNVATGIVRASPVPQFTFADCADPLWLTYASRCFFKDKPQDAAVPPAASKGLINGNDLDPSDFLTLQTRFTTNEDGWLTQLAYLHPGKNIKTGRPLTEPFQMGFTNVNFRVDRFAAFAGEINIPAAASMETYYLSFREGSAVLRKRIQYSVICTNALVAARSDFRPAIPGIIAVQEERFNNADKKNLHFSYRVTERWLTDAEVRALPEYGRIHYLNPGVKTKGKAKAFLFTFIGFNIIFIGFFLLRNKHKMQTDELIQHPTTNKL